MHSNLLQIILIAQLTYLITCQEGEKENQVMVRDKRQTYTVYYLCGSPPNNYLSKTPCNNNNCPSCNPSNCQVRCSTTQYCRNQNRNWTCQNGCCRTRPVKAAKFLMDIAGTEGVIMVISAGVVEFAAGVNLERVSGHV
ncbi:hypothetical protein WR25_19748 [Diploscapter pachys]|uniref:Uncharacterized protein n=1 Tax=Diploscapter pachys TaxID=2018661 RepID=A0A2A2LPN1_9BILA|nr:hypothetical protein WR25_19748 [Diploscapter pachys]